MKYGFNQEIITPPLNNELVGYVPSRISLEKEKDLYAKTIVLLEDDNIYVWLTVDMLGLDLFIKETLLNKLESENIYITDLQMFSTHTHSGPRCLNKEEYHDSITKQEEKEYFEFLVKQIKTSIIKSIDNAQDFTYRVARGQMHDFQSNRNYKDGYSFNDILTIEVIQADNTKGLLYSFSGHPTILDSKSQRISPDYVGEVSRIIEEQYAYSMFFNSPCGDMSTRFTKKESSLSEVYRLADIAAKHVLKTTKNLSETKTINNYQVEHYPYKFKYKEFLSLKEAERQFEEASKQFEEAKQANLDPLELRKIRGTYEGVMFNLFHSQKNINEEYLSVNVYLVRINDFTIINVGSELFSTLNRPLVSDKTWTISLSDQFNTYICDKQAYDDNTYEALSSLYPRGEGEKFIEFIKSKL